VGSLVRSRLAPAIVFAVGLSLVAVGLLTWVFPIAAGGAEPSPSAMATPDPLPTPSPLTIPAPSPGASASPSAPVDAAVATRIVIPRLRIDLPVVEGPEGYPWCNVAMFHSAFHQPGETGATFIFAHAREGMFLPLLEQSLRQNGARMLDMLVQVYTADDRVHTYTISQVLRHQPTLDKLFAATTEQLWLQTSEGPAGTVEKLHVVATPVSVLPADAGDAHPKPRPIDCG
jgi:hypothetical protein